MLNMRAISPLPATMTMLYEPMYKMDTRLRWASIRAATRVRPAGCSTHAHCAPEMTGGDGRARLKSTETEKIEDNV